jgi:hypothetical protein
VGGSGLRAPAVGEHEHPSDGFSRRWWWRFCGSKSAAHYYGRRARSRGIFASAGEQVEGSSFGDGLVRLSTQRLRYSPAPRTAAGVRARPASVRTPSCSSRSEPPGRPFLPLSGSGGLGLNSPGSFCLSAAVPEARAQAQADLAAAAARRPPCCLPAWTSFIHRPERRLGRGSGRRPRQGDIAPNAFGPALSGPPSRSPPSRPAWRAREDRHWACRQAAPRPRYVAYSDNGLHGKPVNGRQWFTPHLEGSSTPFDEGH